MNEDGLLVYRGGEVKALGSGRVGGRLVVFKSTDQVGDMFDSDTDYFLEGGRGRIPVLLEHGLHPQMKTRRLGRGDVTLHDDGLHILAELELKDSASRRVYEQVEAGELAWSSGSAPHLVTRTKLGTRTNLIRSWPLVEASLTRTPCEPLAVATALKSFADHATFEDLIVSPAQQALKAVMEFELMRFEHLRRNF